MDKFKLIGKIKELYLNGDNIIQYLRSIENRDINSIEDILISYDFQSGSYIKGFAKNQEFKHNYCSSIAKVINELCDYKSLIEIGVGEATTLGILLKYLNDEPKEILGFDISWSRLMFAKEFLNDFNYKNIKLFTANLFEIPLLDNSIDIVYTSHSIEPNGGKEELALTELYRITNKYLVLLEPAYEFANDESKERMKQHGYVTNLYSTAMGLGYKVIEHRLFDLSANPLNPTGLMIIEKENNEDCCNSELVCPVSRTKLKEYHKTILYSEDSLLAYPMINNIPCLLKENAILATHYLTNYKEFKKIHNIKFTQ